MGFVEIRTLNGWQNLDDLTIAKDTCTVCADIVSAEGEGYVSIDPLIFLCRNCRINYADDKCK